MNLKLSDTRVYAPQIRARLGTTAHVGVGHDEERDQVAGEDRPEHRHVGNAAAFSAASSNAQWYKKMLSGTATGCGTTEGW